MNYQRNKELAKTRDHTPSLTDQAAARDSDINIIVAQYTIHGQAPGTSQNAMYDDFTQLPQDLREYIEHARTLKDRLNELPEAFRTLDLEQILALTNEQITLTLTPETPVPEPAKT